MRVWQEVASPTEWTGSVDIDDPFLCATAALSLHANTRGGTNTVNVDSSNEKFDGLPLHSVTFICESCPYTSASYAGVPLTLIPVLAVAFHSRHEGHPFKLELDGEPFPLR